MMKIAFIAIILLHFLSCTENAEFIKPSQELDTISTNQSIIENGTNQMESEKVNEKDSIEMDSLIKLWTWNEIIAHPKSSSINNFLFSTSELFQDWGDYYSDEFNFRFSIDEAYLRLENLELVYTINFDSLRIFSQAENLTNGIDRGIITHLDKDSMVIVWSDNEKGVYYSRYN